MNVSDVFFRILADLSHFNVIALVSISGFVLINRNAFGSALFITIFTMALNAYLKSIWQVPLNPELNKEGWAFPSGHTQSSCVFWFFLSLMLEKRWMIICIPVVLLGVVSGIVHFGYHEWYEILAAIGFAGLEIIFFFYLLKIWDYYQIGFYHLGFLLSIVIVLFLSLLLLPNKQGYFWLWNGLGGMLGISIGWMLLERIFENYEIKHKLVMSGILLALFGGIYFGFHFDETKIVYNSIITFIIGLVISIGLPLIDRRISKYYKM
ncbi:phosphatase PAP2 family protein [Candidatus Jidaibacter acanthamoebae]|uniref:phosphatase PAP2 family protein n=1 Tax=Candidatus Jidaibacter acanthamoebae TaxID=86105 RepID=UPI00126A5A51|nr:phosphatase PAP2 family protein [Candidatus Jidaibacter acanthamoeba]